MLRDRARSACRATRGRRSRGRPNRGAARARAAPRRSTDRKPSFELVRDRRLDLERRHALERALDHEVAHGLVEQTFAPRSERRDTRAPRAARARTDARTRLRHAGAIVGSLSHGERGSRPGGDWLCGRTSARPPARSPTTRTSSSSRTPERRCRPRLRTRSISCLDVRSRRRRPSLTMKFACFGDTTAPPTRAPFKARAPR